MKQYTTTEQTAKLIELGFEKPKSIIYASAYQEEEGAEPDVEYEYAYSIGELIEMLNRVDDEKLEICRDCGFWLVGTDLYCVPCRDLIDALYDIVTLLKEKRVI